MPSVIVVVVLSKDPSICKHARTHSHDKVIGPEGRQHEEVDGRVLVGEREVDLLGPDAEAGLAVE